MSKSAIAKSVLIAGGLVGLVPSFAIGAEQTGLDIADNDSVYIDGKTFQITPGKAKADTAVQIKNLSARELGPGAIVIRSGDKLYIADGQGQAVAVAPSYAYDPQSSRPVLSGGGSFGYNQNAATNYAYDPQSSRPVLSGGGSFGYNQNAATNNAYDPQSSRPVLSGGGSFGYNQNAATNYAYDPQSSRPVLSGGGSFGYNQNAATNYAYDPQSSRPVLSGGGSFGYNQNAATNYAYDPQAYPIRNPNPWANNYAYDPQAFPMRNPDPWANNYAYDPRRGTQPAMLYDSDYVEYRLKKAFQDNWTPVAAN